MRTVGRREVSLTGAACKLNGQAGPVHIRSIFVHATVSGLLALHVVVAGIHIRKAVDESVSRDFVRALCADRDLELTRNHIPSIQCIIILDEAEAIHELDLGNVSSTILEVVLDVFLRDCGSGGQRVPSEVLKMPVGVGHSITDPFEARGDQTLNKGERKGNPSSVMGRPRIQSAQSQDKIMGLA